MQTLLLNSISYREEVETHLSNSKMVSILTAYLTSPGVAWLLSYLCDSARVQVVGRFDVQDFVEGASDFKALRTLLMAGHEVRMFPRLHAKLIMFDGAKVCLGSANLTSRGLGLIQNHNFEIGVVIEVSPTDAEFVADAIEASFELNLDLLALMEQHVSSIDISSVKAVPSDWPSSVFFTTPTEMLVRDFPADPPGSYSESLPTDFKSAFAEIHALRHDFEASKILFKKTKSYKWLVTLLSGSDIDEGLSFGEVTQRLHTVLADDPAPYRRTVKELQINLYEYCRLYSRDTIEFYKPGSRSEFIKLRKPQSSA